jgi:citrate lyase beta subunit
MCSIVETARGVLEVAAIASPTAPAHRLCFGPGFHARHRCRMEREAKSFTARSMIVLASRAAGLRRQSTASSSISTIPTGWRPVRESEAAGLSRQDGDSSSRVAIVNGSFTPTAQDVAWARKVIDGLAAAEREGLGAFVVDGRMVDYPIVERARDIQASGAT